MSLEKEIAETHLVMSDEDDPDEFSFSKSKVSVCKRILDDSSDEECTNTNEESGNPIVETLSKSEKDKEEITLASHKKKKTILDGSDSEEETVSSHGGLLTADGEMSTNVDDVNGKSSYKSMFQNNDLYDAEGSSDEDSHRKNLNDYELEELNLKCPKEKSGTKGAKKRSAPQRKSKQSALEEIHSETQRLIRHSRVSLPYHQPKQRSLSEFLSRRKPVAIVPLKTSSEQLCEVWQSIEEREKSAEQFYKSESDSTEEETIPESAETNKDTVLPHDNGELSLSETIVKNNLVASVTESSPQEGCSSGDLENSLICSKNSEPVTECAQLPLTVENSSNNSISDKNENKLLYTKMMPEDNVMESIEESSNNPNSENTNKTEDEKTENFKLILIPEQENFHSTEDSALGQSEQCSDSLNHTLNKPTDVSNKLEEKKRLSLLNNSLLDIKLDVTPKISGNPEEVIDLDKVAEKPAALKLVTRFMKHVRLKPKQKNQEEKVSVAIAEVNTKGEIVNLSEEVLSIKTSDKSKPGETRFQLKAKLKQKMAQSREEQFVKRIEEYKLSEEMYEGEKDVCSDLEDVDEEIEPLETSGSESEPEENDVDLSDKRKNNDNPFLDEEAEESENEDDEANEVEPECDTYSDPPSIDIAPLVDDKDEFSDISKTQDAKFSENGALSSDIMALCSGVFPTQAVSIKDLEKTETTDIQSEGFNLFIPEDATMDICGDERRLDGKEGDESSDEEVVTKKTKKKARLEFSDDEDDDNSVKSTKSNKSLEEHDEEEDTNDNELVETDNEEIQDEEEDVLDEEEEEIFKNPSKAAKRFLEDEAELSGSEYGSADEDEVDLDNYEEEQGDQDQINQKKLRTELEKIHMKEILDEDKREIRILQELLLEDGELHSDGPRRQRQFKWYNQDETDADRGIYLNSFDDEEDEGEGAKEIPEVEDESWRKTRLERENFLQTIQNADDDLDIMQCLNKYSKIEKKIVKSSAPKVATISSPNPKRNFSLISKRGSFLNRGEKVLSKLAEMTNTSSENPLGNSRGKKNMVFAIVSPPKEEEPQEQVKKRKSTASLPEVKKRLKLSPGNLNISSKKSIFENLD